MGGSSCACIRALSIAALSHLLALMAVKAMKAMKSASKIAKGKYAKSVVFRGSKAKTASGLTKASLIKSKRGKIVSKRKSALGKKAYSHISGWNKACQQAKKVLGLKGFVAINGKGGQGRALYAK